VSGYPFSAVVGLDDLRLALLLNAVSPAVGGVLVRGEKGTAKSTVVRALAALLPGLAVVVGCRFSCDPARPDPVCPDGPHEPGAARATRPARLVELPIGATEDRLVGSLDLERALTEGVKAFEPGLLADAHRGVLYVDEVNLLHDHLVDLLLDVAAMGSAHVAREGVSVTHAARVLLVGTMNPEEGELRPQLLDRFGLTVEVTASRDPQVRVEVVRRRLAYEASPDAFAARWAPAEADLAARIRQARSRLGTVVLPERALHQIARICAAFEVDGMRADLVTARTAIAHAAWHGRGVVTAEDVRQAALLALPHRKRRNPFDAPGLDQEALDEALNSESDDGPDEDPRDDGPGGGGGGGGSGDGGGGQPEPVDPPRSAPESDPSPEPTTSDSATGSPADTPRSSGRAAGAARQPDQVAAAGTPFQARLLTVPGVGGGATGRRSRAETPTGRTTGSRRPTDRATGRPLHVLATLVAAAPHQRTRGRIGVGLLVRRDDVRTAVREGREGNLVLFVVDASGSMAARQRMHAVKGAVLSLLLDAYQRRDKVGMITFRGTSAQLALPPTSSVEAGAARLGALPTGGRSPVAAGLRLAFDVLRRERLKDPQRRPLLIVVTDGRATGTGQPVAEAHRAAAVLAATGTCCVVVDCEDGPVRLGLAGALAEALGAPTLRLDELAADHLAAVARAARPDRKVA